MKNRNSLLSFNPILSLIKQVVSKFMDTPVDEEILIRLQESWNQEIGNASVYAFPILFKSGKLVIFCESPVWGTQFRYQTPSILKNLKKQHFHATKIKIKVQPKWEITKYQKTSSIEPIYLSSHAAEKMQSIARTITHSRLKEAIGKLIKRHQS